MRPIDADALPITPYRFNNTDYAAGWNTALKIISETAKTVDAEPVVRCKGCEWWAQNEELGTHYGVCYRFNAVTSKSAHCSYGRRKESEA